MLNEVTISRPSLDSYFKKLSNCLELDVVIVGGMLLSGRKAAQNILERL
jgi:ribulose 1,5-bisphosphate synthetase/thiazole synthase